MWKLFILFFGLFLISALSYGQAISESTQFSLITCDEGDEIYSLFGHSAIRVKDKVSQLDLVYNWGMFEFGENELDFQIKFAKGKLRYYMAEETFTGFVSTYQWENRTVREQVLDLSYEQKLALWKGIQENYKPENRYYKYDFFFDNCATRISALLEEALGNEVLFSELPKANTYSYRQLIDKQVSTSQPWSDFGIDLALGVRIDKITNSKEMQFLPKYLEQSLDLATKNGSPLVLATNELVKGEVRSNDIYNGTFPSTVTWTIFIVGLLIHVFNLKRLAQIYDSLFLIIITFLGVLVVFLWFYTDHQPTKGNYNLLWANPLYIIMVFVFFVKANWARFFYAVTAFYALGIILFWIAFPQELNPAVRPLILLQVLISYYWFKNFRLKVIK